MSLETRYFLFREGTLHRRPSHFHEQHITPIPVIEEAPIGGSLNTQSLGSYRKLSPVSHGTVGRLRRLQVFQIHTQLFQQAIQIIEVRELQGDLALALAHIDPHRSFEPVGEL